MPRHIWYHEHPVLLVKMAAKDQNCKVAQKEYKSSRKNAKPMVLELRVDYYLNSNVFSLMINGIIKHILYHREQIPQPFDQLMKTYMYSQCAQNVSNLARANAQLKENQILKITKTFGELFERLEAIFVSVEKIKIKRIAVILGATLFTPKEIHCIEFPVLFEPSVRFPLTDQPPPRRCITQMFRALFIASNNVTWPKIYPTNIIILVEMKRDCKVDWFLPKMSYTLPNQGYTITYKIMTPTGTPNVSAPNYRSTTDCGISSIRPEFEIYESPQIGPRSQPDITTNAVDAHLINGIGDLNISASRSPSVCTEVDDYIWFQMPNNVKGFVSKP